jgi:hypothetical protein
MFEKLAKLEEKLNVQIVGVQNTFIRLYFLLMPKFIIRFYANIKAFVKKMISSFKLFINKYIERSKLKVAATKDKSNIMIQRVSTYTDKYAVFSFLEKVKILLLKTPLKSHAVSIVDTLKRKINHVDGLAIKAGKGELAFGVVALTVIGFGFFSVINSTNQILLTEFPDRSPASVQEYKYKPEYKTFEKRTIKILNLKVPVFRESVKDIRSVTVDFTVRTDTRFAKQYLAHYENQLRDYFFTNVEPVVSSFPIEEEGKLVFKEKITDDLNNFLKENNVEGSVEEVGVSFIVAH